MEEDEAFANLVGVLQVVKSDGVSAFQYPDVAVKYRFNESLAVLSKPPLNVAAGELLVRKVFEVFADTTIVEYQRDMCSGRESLALRHLHERYQQTFAIISDWCGRLNSEESVALFTVSLRCHLLQPDLLTDESPPGKKELLSFLELHGHRVLKSIEEAGSAHSFTRVVDGSCDEVLQELHDLTLSSTSDIKALWKSVLVNCTLDRIASLDDDDFTVARIQSYMQWKDDVVDVFVRMALSPDPDDSEQRSEVNRWCKDLEQLLLVSYGQKRIASFWDVVVEYPDSTPTLQDLRFCLQRCTDDTLRNGLIKTVKWMLVSRLHRAGTRTEDILAILIGTIHSLCVLVPKNDQSSMIFTIVGDTLEHLKKRKDCVSAVVQAMTQPSGDSTLNIDLRNYASTGSALDNGDSFEGVWDATLPGTEQSSLSLHEKPDVLRVLLATISVNSLVEEYRQVLASQLLGKPMHNFDTSAEEEVLERLKCAFGEDVLAPCVVMIRDIQASRRYTQQLGEMHEGRATSDKTSSVESRRDWPLSLDVLSTTSWPKLSSCLPAGETQPIPDKYNPHPELASAMDDAKEGYKRLKANQRLEWVLSHGNVTLELQQKEVSASRFVAVTYDLSLFSASIVLYVRDISAEVDAPAPLVAVAERMGVKPQVLQQRISHLIPSVLLSADDNKTLSVQTNYVSTSNFTFDDAEEGEEQPAGLSPDQMNMLLSMLKAMLKAREACGASDIFNSMKMFGQFQGSIDDMRRLLQIFVAQGKLAVNEAKLYTLPKG
ncbi:hypothetical protein, conserved [Trypanosoma brucei gambiense DAL972]|uniref:Anaphase-promoting complex subunit 2 n=1 Tax=Trypanosoma brucei gambiense (strain MHOM/CI/86/DAL972) TaxID=679716 RepID=C9ZYV9_TRYB9|nr:hypothetical protein, conserved [Trypanosoma brucei gambiense DAL972]CBH14608.1 hypothetical protein, conserved [Trypanosoma brucei gambiense DAL972]|eukprot:XP_011776874.1 hypothetical protein, conserved [Trypanosoma brucei gambiense DAL972]